VHLLAFITSISELLIAGILILPVIALYAILKCASRNARKPAEPRNILITGANSGIGEALALHYAKAGITLALIGRNKDRLEKVCAACKSKGSVVVSAAVDVTDKAGMERFVLDFDKSHPVDLVIANAGMSAGTSGFQRDIVASTRVLFDVNVLGVFNTVLPLIQPMKDRGSGQIAIMSSIAGTGVLMEAPDYSATKVAIRTWAEGLRALLYRDGIFVNVICPGFVESPMTDVNKEYRMPLMQTMPAAIERMTRGLAHDEPVIVFPRLLYFAMWFMNLLPPDVRHVLGRWSKIPAFSYLRTRKNSKKQQ